MHDWSWWFKFNSFGFRRNLAMFFEILLGKLSIRHSSGSGTVSFEAWHLMLTYSKFQTAI